jgi:hypothetical protein
MAAELGFLPLWYNLEIHGVCAACRGVAGG